MSYNTESELTAHLNTNVGKSWPLREKCDQQEADRRADIHRKAGRIVLVMIMGDGDYTQRGWTTFNPVPDPKPESYEITCDSEQSLDIEYTSPSA